MTRTLAATRRRGLRASLCLLVSAGVLATAPSALAQGPWPVDGQNPYSFRNSSDGPGSVQSLAQVWRRDFDSDVTGTPIVASNGGVYFGTWAGEVHALQYLNGRTVWARGASPVGGPVAGSLLYANNTIFAAASTTGSPRVVALDPTDGSIKWTTVVDNQGHSDVWGSPAYSAEQNLVYVPICACKAERDGVAGVRTRGGVVAVDATSGAIVWKTHTVPPGLNGGAVSGTPAVFDFAGRLYVTTGHAYSGTAHPYTNAILSLDTATGEIVGVYQAVPGDSGTSPANGRGFVAGPIGFRDPNGSAVRVGAGARNGTFYAVDYLTMERAWETHVGVGSRVGGLYSAVAWDGKPGTPRLFGVSAVPTLFWGINTDGAGSISFVHPGTDPLHHGPVTYGRDYVWSTDSAGFLDIQSTQRSGLLAHRLALGAPSTGGVSFGFRRAFVAVGTGRGTGGAIVSYR